MRNLDTGSSMSSNEMFSLPIVDLEKAKTDRKAVAEEVVNGLENVGFLYIDGIKGIDRDKLMSCCKWFFGLSNQQKRTVVRNLWNKDNKNVYRGYFPVNKDTPSRKEAFEFAKDVDPDDSAIQQGNWFYETSVWPKEDGTVPFKEFMTNCYEILHNAALEILRLAAIGLQIDEHAYDKIFADRPCSTFRLIHYPPWDGNPPSNAIVEDGKVVVTPDHTDSNFLTLLCTFDFAGLEVLNPDGKWIAVEPRQDSWIMNIGDVFSRMMGGRFKATRHQVLDIGIDRYSVPFFLEPSFDGDIGLNWMTKVTGEGPKHEVERYGPWVLQQMKHVKKYEEYLALPEF